MKLHVGIYPLFLRVCVSQKRRFVRESLNICTSCSFLNFVQASCVAASNPENNSLSFNWEQEPNLKHLFRQRLAQQSTTSFVFSPCCFRRLDFRKFLAERGCRHRCCSEFVFLKAGDVDKFDSGNSSSQVSACLVEITLWNSMESMEVFHCLLPSNLM